MCLATSVLSLARMPNKMLRKEEEEGGGEKRRKCGSPQGGDGCIKIKAIIILIES